LQNNTNQAQEHFPKKMLLTDIARVLFAKPVSIFAEHALRRLFHFSHRLKAHP
jgi:hypothetical protein